MGHECADTEIFKTFAQPGALIKPKFRSLAGRVHLLLLEYYSRALTCAGLKYCKNVKFIEVCRNLCYI